MAAEGDKVEIGFMSPGANIVGFEHPATSETDKAAIRSAMATLTAGEKLFIFPEPADCQLADADVHGPASDGTTHSGHSHGSDKETHTEFEVRYQFQCANPSALTHIDVRIFDVFPGTEEIDAQFITPRGQGARELTPKSPRLDL